MINWGKNYTSKSIHYTDVRFAPLQMKPLKAFFFSWPLRSFAISMRAPLVNHLNHTMLGGCTGTSPIAWPPASPDLTPMDSFPRGYVKDLVCQVKNNAKIAHNVLQNTWIRLACRLDIRLATSGAHTGIYLGNQYSGKKKNYSFPL